MVFTILSIRDKVLLRFVTFQLYFISDVPAFSTQSLIFKAFISICNLSAFSSLSQVRNITKSFITYIVVW